jgi:NAD(P)-dependent dehydrogenase (short-subunit alcohol dehydrogenase family)
MLLQNQVALITGSGRGIGRAIARLFAKEGASVFLAARTEKELAATAAEIVKDGGRAAFATADLAEETDCKRAVSAVREEFGKIDILVNNAGHYGPVVPVEEYPVAEFDKIIAVHLRAAFLLSRLVLHEMYAQVGSDSEPVEPFREGRVFLGIRVRRGEGRHARLDARDRCRSGAQGRARERFVSRPGHGNANVERARRGAGEENGRQPGRAVEWISRQLAARPRANRR